MLSIEDVESATILYGLGQISDEEYKNILLEFAIQPENPVMIQTKARLKPRHIQEIGRAKKPIRNTKEAIETIMSTLGGDAKKGVV